MGTSAICSLKFLCCSQFQCVVVNSNANADTLQISNLISVASVHPDAAIDTMPTGVGFSFLSSANADDKSAALRSSQHELLYYSRNCCLWSRDTS